MEQTKSLISSTRVYESLTLYKKSGSYSYTTVVVVVVVVNTQFKYIHTYIQDNLHIYGVPCYANKHICVDKSMQKFLKPNRKVDCATQHFRPGGHLVSTMN